MEGDTSGDTLLTLLLENEKNLEQKLVRMNRMDLKAGETSASIKEEIQLATMELAQISSRIEDLEKNTKVTHTKKVKLSHTNSSGDDFSILHHQTHFTPTKGNALQASIATFFQEANLNSVPNFIEFPDPYLALQKYLAQKNLCFVKIMCDDNGKLPECATYFGTNCLCLVAGPSPRSLTPPIFRHVVIGRLLPPSSHQNISYVFDPHPSNDFLRDPPTWVGLFVQTKAF